MKRIIIFGKGIAKWALISTIGIGVSTAAFIKSGIPHRFFKDIAMTELAKAIPTGASIAEVGGDLVSQIKIKNIKFNNDPSFSKSPILEVNHITIKYNPLKLLFPKAVPIDILGEVDIENVTINIIRNKKGEWNLSKVITRNKKETEIPPLPEKIKFKNIYISYTDHLGLSEKPLQNPFSQSFRFKDGTLIIKNQTQANIVLNPDKRDKKLSKIEANANLKSGQFLASISTKLRLDDWGPYLLPFSEFSLTGDDTAINAILKTKPAEIPAEVPFWFDINIKTNKAKIKTTLLNEDIQQLKTSVRIVQGTIPKTIVSQALIENGDTENKVDTVWNKWIKMGLISKEGMVLRKVKNSDFKNQNSAIKKTRTILKTPLIYILFTKAEAKIADIPLNGSGYIQLGQPRISLDIQTQPYEIKNLKKVFSPLETLNISGKSQSQIAITGELSSPELSVVTVINEGNFYNVHPKKLVTNIRLKSGILEINTPYSDIYGGEIIGGGTVDLESPTGNIKFEFSGKNINVGQLYPSPFLKGKLNFSTKIEGDSSRVLVSFNAIPNQLAIGKNQINNIDAQLEISKEAIKLNQLSLGLNDQNMSFSAKGDIVNNILNMSLFGNDIHIKDFDPESLDHRMGSLKINADIKAVLPKKNEKWSLSTLHASVNSSGKEIPFYGALYNHIGLKAHTDGTALFLDYLIASNNLSKIVVSGRINQNELEHLKLDVKSIPLTTIPEFKKLVPKTFFPVAGLLSAQMEISKNNTENSFKNTPENYTIKGKVLTKKGMISGQEITTINANIEWNGNRLKISDAAVMHGNSKLFLEVNVASENHEVEIKKASELYFHDFESILGGINFVNGKVELDGKLKNKNKEKSADINFSIQNFKGNFLEVDQIKGSVRVEKNKLDLKDFQFKNKNTIVNSVGTAEFPKDKNESWKYNFNIEFPEADLGVLSKFAEESKYETEYFLNKNRKAFKKFERSTEKAFKNSADFERQDPNGASDNIKLYGFKQDSLAFFYDNEIESHFDIKEVIYTKWANLFGKLSGKISIESQKNNMPKVDAQLTVKDFKKDEISAKEITLQVSSGDQESVYEFSINSGSFGANPYDRLLIKGHLDHHGRVWISQSEIEFDSLKIANPLTGKFPLSAYWNPKMASDPIDLTLSLERNDINVVSLIVPGIKEVKNNGKLILKLSGPVERAVIIPEEINLENVSIKVKDKSKKITEVKVQAIDKVLKKNTLTFTPLNIDWPTDSTKKMNKIALHGDVSISPLNLKDPKKITVDINLKADPTSLQVTVPALFHGKLNLNALEIQGPYTIALSKDQEELQKTPIWKQENASPKITTNFKIYEGEILIDRPKNEESKSNFALDIEAEVGRDIRVQGGFLGKNILAGLANTIDVELRENPIPLKITGTSFEPIITNSILFNQGALTLLNRTFDLLSIAEQELFFENEKYKVRDNELSFNVEELPTGRKRIVPILHLSAVNIIEPVNISTDNQQLVDNNPYGAIVINFNGSAFKLDNIQINHYTMTNINPRISTIIFQRRYSLSSPINSNGQDRAVNELVQIIAPELALQDRNQNPSNTTQTQKLINTVGENQINQLVRREFLRPVERGIAQNIGLYDFRLNYNFGRAVIGGNQRSTQDDDLAISLVHQLIQNKLFLRAKTNLDLGQQTQNRDKALLSEVELQYFLLRQFSVGFANTQDNNERIARQKLSLKYSYEF